MEKKFDFSGWATKANLKCSDGRIITKDAFNHCDGKTVPLVWGHQHNDPLRVLGHALLECRDDGVYTYGKFNDTEQGQNAKILVEHGDVVALSIYANQLRQDGPNVLHGAIREVSLVLAGANPGAIIENVITHSEDGTDPVIDPTRAYCSFVVPEAIELYHEDEAKPAEKKESDDSEGGKTVKEVLESIEKKLDEDELNVIYAIVGSAADADGSDDDEDDGDDDVKHADSEGGKTVKEVWESIEKKLDEDEMNLVYGIIGGASAESDDDEDDGNDDTDKDENNKIKHNESEGGNETMKQNVFDNTNKNDTAVLTHADQVEIIKLAKTSGVGSLQQAIQMYCADNEHLAHGIEELETLFPEFKNLDPGAPDLLTRDQGWVTTVMNKVAKSPFSRVRTRQADARIAALRAKGYKKGEEKTVMANIKLLGRQTEPQTVYIKDELNRDDILDITDFSVVDYEKKIMKMTMNEEVATAIMVGDGRDDGDPDKIHEDRIRPIWKDEDLYTIHRTIDFAAEKAELQGTNTGANFSDNYIYAEAIVKHLLYAREQYKASGELEMYCDPHLVNVMLLARDLNGHRMYKTRADLAAALDVTAIHTAEQFAGLTRTDAKTGKTYKLLGLFVNLNNYQVGATKGGEITTFDQFDIDFNKQKFLMEARLSGALTEPYSAIALEELVTE